MANEILIAIISGTCVAIPSIVTTFMINRKNAAIQEFKIDELTKHVEKHNQVIDRTYKLELAVAVMDKEIKTMQKE